MIVDTSGLGKSIDKITVRKRSTPSIPVEIVLGDAAVDLVTFQLSREEFETFFGEIAILMKVSNREAYNKFIQ